MSKSKVYAKPLNLMLKTAEECLNFNTNQSAVLSCMSSDLQKVNDMILSLATDTSFSVRQQYRKAISEIISNLNNYVQLTNRNYANTPFTLATSGSDDMNGTLVPYQSVSFSRNEFLTNFAYNKYCIGTANLGCNISGDKPNSYYMSSFPIQPCLGSTLTSLGTITSSVIGTGINENVDDLATVLFTFTTTQTLALYNCISVNNVAYKIVNVVPGVGEANPTAFNAKRVDGIPVSADDCFSTFYPTTAVYSIITVKSAIITNILTFTYMNSNTNIPITEYPACIYVNDLVLINNIAYIITTKNTNIVSVTGDTNSKLAFTAIRADGSDISSADVITPNGQFVQPAPMFKILNTLALAVLDIFPSVTNVNTKNREIYGICVNNHQQYYHLVNGAINDINLLIEKNNILADQIKAQKNFVSTLLLDYV